MSTRVLTARGRHKKVILYLDLLWLLYFFLHHYRAIKAQSSTRQLLRDNSFSANHFKSLYFDSELELKAFQDKLKIVLQAILRRKTTSSTKIARADSNTHVKKKEFSYLTRSRLRRLRRQVRSGYGINKKAHSGLQTVYTTKSKLG